jgi:hypothetical protein
MAGITTSGKSSASAASPAATARSLEALAGDDRLDALSLRNTSQLSSGGFVTAINFAGDMTQFANALRNQYWKAGTVGSIGGITFAVGDKLVCRQNITGTPVDLTNTAEWANEVNLDTIATTTVAGVVKPANGMSVAVDGTISVKLSTGLKFDASNNVLADEPNIDALNLRNSNLLSTGAPKGGFNDSASLATFSSGVIGNWWVFGGTNGFVLGGQTFNNGDQLWVRIAFSGTPAELTTNFVKVSSTVGQASSTVFGTVKLGALDPVAPATAAAIGISQSVSREDHAHILPAVLVGATPTVVGTKGLVPAPPAGNVEMLLSGGGTWKNTLRTLSITVDDKADPTLSRFGILASNGVAVPEIRYLSNSNIRVKRVTAGTVETPTTQVEVLGFMSDGRVEIQSLTLPNHPNGRVVMTTELDITATASSAYVSTGLSITLPVAGTYMIEQSIRSGVTANNVSYIVTRLFNVTGAVALANTEVLCAYSSGNGIRSPLTSTSTSPVTVTGSTVIRLDATRYNAATSAAVESSVSGRTTLTWWKIA